MKSKWLRHFEMEDFLIKKTVLGELTQSQADELLEAMDNHPHVRRGEQIDECLRVYKRF